MGDYGAAAAAALYVASNVYSWAEAKAMPKLQAEANKEVLALQKAHYDALAAEQRGILNAAISTYVSNVDGLLSGTDFEDAFPDVPEVAAYVPVDVCCEQARTIECNISKTDRADDYVRYVNRLHEQNDLIHVLSMDSGFLVKLDIQNKALTDMMRGRLTVGDVVEVLTDNAEQASLTGRIGNTRKTTARDFGISKMRVQAAGRKEFRESTAWLNERVSPLSRQHDITEMMLTPAMRVQVALTQAQLIQNSLQNVNNAAAQKEPYLMAKLQTQMAKQITLLQQKASVALLANTHVPNYAAVVFPKLSNTSQLVGSIGQAVQYANSSHFFGPPPASQDGYRGQPASGATVSRMNKSPGTVDEEDQGY